MVYITTVRICFLILLGFFPIGNIISVADTEGGGGGGGPNHIHNQFSSYIVLLGDKLPIYGENSL